MLHGFDLVGAEYFIFLDQVETILNGFAIVQHFLGGDGHEMVRQLEIGMIEVVLCGDNVFYLRTLFGFLQREGADEYLLVGYCGSQSFEFGQCTTCFCGLSQGGSRFEVVGEGKCWDLIAGIHKLWSLA